ncbi:MAG: hypothetical protein ACODAJ_00430 [Planctomycetota bacterium]
MLIGIVSLAVAAAIWLPCLRAVFDQPASRYHSAEGVPPKARAMAAWHLRLWTEPELRGREVEQMRGSNAEWDFMGRTFLVLALGNMALRDAATKPRALDVMDRIIDETLRLEREEGLYHFLMPYARSGRWAMQPPRSQFLDGEIALMLAVRRLVEEKPAYRGPLAERVAVMVERMRASPTLCCESYPDECWLFCNTIGLAAIRLADVLDGTDHSAFFRDWLAAAKRKLVHEETGLLLSAFTVRGQPLHGPEGTSIWAAAHFLQLIDPELAADQYRRAREQLGRRVLGFGYSREWPPSWQGWWDIDSGPVVPVLGASASASGLACIGASAFDDAAYLDDLMASLRLGAFPVRRDGGLKLAASNQVGDAVVLYAMVLGPVWDEAERRARDE